MLFDVPGLRVASRRGFLRAALAGAAVAGATPLIARAVTEEEIETAEREQAELERLAQEEQTLLAAAQAREGALQQQLAVIDRQRFAAVERLRDVNRQLETVELEVFDINASIANLNRALARETDNLGARVRSLYKAGRTSMLETVLSSSSFSEALDRATSLERALAQDLEEIDALRRSRQTVHLRTADLAARLQQMDELRQEAAVIESELQRRSQEQQDLIFGVQQEQTSLDANVDAFQAEAAVVGSRILVLRDIRQRELAQLERILALQQAQEQARELARQVAATQGTSVAGVYTWPLWGLITTEFGGCTFGQCPHIGIDIAEDMLAPVVAANDGIVLVADYVVPGNRQASYGMIVVIAHNQNEETLYAHLDDWTSPPPVSPGQFVSRGQVIGYVGLTGWTTGPHLHFEYRVNGVAQNPRNVLV
ncbi:MAG: peptidoglycan DD-metalloendopeptidase family protein [Chloroflexota bacterium]|nr:peptidoglycan DD-metalloendopeptidase family protein [Chloroflexota bacterium]MDE2918265.1 peptidoglycan DD-metalloendopeptidase family protein [Chloroflexota bacterium]